MIIFHSFLPPPISGMSYISQLIYKKLYPFKRILVLDTNPFNFFNMEVSSKKKLGFYLRRLICFIRIWSVLLFSNKVQGKNVYFALDDNMAMLLSAISIIISSKRCNRIWVHHHSHRYLNKHSKIFSTITSMAPDLTHIVLCPNMEKRLRTLYPKICHTTVLNNAFSVTSRHYRKDSSKKIVLGHLSNLSPEKGFFILVPLFERCRELGFPVELRIAGPANCKNILIEIQRLKKKYQNEVTYHGPIYGKLKQEFYSDLDFFVFPSFYEAEAQPIVLLEAMSCSSIPLASSSGGIPHILEKSPIAPLHLENFVDEGIEVIRRYVFDRRLLDSHRICCKKAFIEMKKISSMQLNMFVDDIVDQGSESSNFNSKLMGSRKLV